MRSAARFLLLASLLAACGGGDGGSGPSDDPDVEGTWSGPVSSSTGLTATLRFTVAEIGGDVSGSGSLSASGNSLSMVVSGSYAAPQLTLTFSATGFEPMTLTGTVQETRIEGTLDGSGFENRAITLRRE